MDGDDPVPVMQGGNQWLEEVKNLALFFCQRSDERSDGVEEPVWVGVGGATGVKTLSCVVETMTLSEGLQDDHMPIDVGDCFGAGVLAVKQNGKSIRRRRLPSVPRS